MLEFYFNNKHILSVNNDCKFSDLLESKLHLQNKEFYFISNGKLWSQIDGAKNDAIIHIVPRMCGGKGGFGSMLRAIGAQIEKTTNREACRDLSGRRLRDINEEKRLKNWIEQQSQREDEVEDKKLKKLEKLVQKPKHEFKDETYEKERSELSERLEEAISQGLAAGSSQGNKRKHEVDDKKKKMKKKKKALWIDDELSGLSSSDDCDSESEDSPVAKDNTDKIEDDAETTNGNDKVDSEEKNSV
ncbi:PREDICTED: protein SDE2 homolog [Nicrophorus vespilloides]|uniref:Protein SDE2 homolog n=1 Tax=Nicrophorus vespilloides TaxID=110193 RepID=A0ABM1MR52_NICVS|nr:PREDICTED: protein SDE2 homolog [Nicrophorus vespilloides]